MEFTAEKTEMKKSGAPGKSLVQVRFPQEEKQLYYFNDLFDLKPGDLVFVEGSMAGRPGRVTQVSYHFKVKLSDYRKVIAVADTRVHGSFYMAGSHFVTFDPAALPPKQIITWFKAPAQEEFVCGTDGSGFPLEDLSQMKIAPVIAQRGHDYYLENRVRYLCLEHTKGFAIVEGADAYTVEFDYRDGRIENLLCDCPCAFTCKHEFAAMLQLKETLELIDKHYGAKFRRSGCFAAVFKGTLFSFAIDGREKGSFTL